MLSKVKLTILAENRVNNPKLIAEQGLSVLVQTSQGNILFDTGQTDAFMHNAIQLGIDLNLVDMVVLSHGHFDHTGGLTHFVKHIKPISVVCHPALTNKKFRVYPNGKVDIGVPWEKKDVTSSGANFIFKSHAHELFPDVWISGEIPRLTEYEFIDETYQQRVLESFIHDEIHDDMSLILNSEKGLIVLLGCGHSGAVNSVKHAMRITHNNTIFAIFGGMHLLGNPLKKIERVVADLKKIDPAFIVPLHCTGFTAMHTMFQHFKGRVKLMNVGDSFDLTAEGQQD